MPNGYLCNLVIISQLKRALTTDGNTVAERMELLEGLNDRKAPFLQKPFDIEELARAVKAAASR